MRSTKKQRPDISNLSISNPSIPNPAIPNVGLVNIPVAGRYTILLFLFLFSNTLFSFGCGENTSPSQNKPVPLGDKQALEQLASSYRNLGEKFGSTPNNLRPKGKRQFIEQVFSSAGYDYSSTLLRIAGVDGSSGLDQTIQLHRDLAELVLLPQDKASKDELASLFSQSEISAINIVLEKLKLPI